MKIIKFLTFLLLPILLVTGCSQDENQLVIGTSADNPPYEFMRDGKIVGLDIEIMELIAKRLGKKLVVKNLDFSGLIAALTTDNVDAIIAGLSITGERRKRVDFSIPYTSSTVAVLYRAKDRFKEIGELKDREVGAQLGTIWGIIAHDLAITAGIKITSLASNLMLIKELEAKRIDAIILEEAQCQKFIAANSKFASFSLNEYRSEFAIALKQGSPLKNEIDNAIRALEHEGVLETLKKKWLQGN